VSDGPKVRVTSISSEFEGVRQYDEDGEVHNGSPVPFYLWSILGGWKATCVKHKLMFQREQSYWNHWEPSCSDIEDLTTIPASDFAIKARGFKRVWL